MALGCQLLLRLWARAQWSLSTLSLSFAAFQLHQKPLFERHAQANAETLSFR